MKYIKFILFFVAINNSQLCAQSITLQQAIDSALANNIDLKQNRVLVDVSQVNWQQAKGNQLPTLNGILNHGINQGRSIDPFTNTYVNQSVNYAGYGLGSGIILFNGLNLQNTIKQTALGYEASKLELQQAKDNLVLNVILAYLEVLTNEDQLLAAGSQLVVSEKQLERLNILDQQGAISPALVSDVRGQLMNDQLTIVNLRNLVEASKLRLTQLMNIPYTKNLYVERVNIDEFVTNYGKSSAEVYEYALKNFAQIKAVELRRKSSEYALKAARGELYPIVALNGNLQTNYSSIAQNTAGKIPYNEQLGNNLFSSLNLGIRIPIFNGRQARNRIRLADLEVRTNELTEENTKVQLRQQVEQAHLNMTASFERYKVLLEQVKAFKQSFEAAEARFNAGVGNSIDYLIAKANFDRANINLISAKYDFLLRKKILDYYQNISWR